MPKKNSAAVELGRKGGKATAKNRTQEQRREAARNAVKARWAKYEKEAKKLESVVKQITKKSKKLLRRVEGN